jgi:hypothetical protein
MRRPGAELRHRFAPRNETHPLPTASPENLGVGGALFGGWDERGSLPRQSREEVETMRSNLLTAASKAEAMLPLAWQRYSCLAIAVLLVGVMLWPLWQSAGEGAETGATPACALWDRLARESIARRVQNGEGDADLRQVGDAVFRLRRARRNCHAGWTVLACQDYLAVARGTSGTVVARSPSAPECAMAHAEAAGATR